MAEPKYWASLQSIVSQPPVVESNLRLMVSSPAGLTTLWVLVEGKADPFFYERMFIVGNVHVIKAGIPDSMRVVRGGYRAVIDLVGKMLLVRNNLLIIGIIDKDWRSFKKTTVKFPANIFVTDRRDLEMTLLSFPRLRKALGAEVMSSMNVNYRPYFVDGKWYKKNGDWFRDVWEKGIFVSRYMGVFHILAAHYQTSRVNFKASCYWDSTNCRLLKGWRENILQAAMKQTGMSPCQMHCKMIKVNLRYGVCVRPFADVCRGHDLMSLLSKQLIDTNHFSEAWLTFFLSKEINLEEIKSMRLYRDLSRWMNQHGVSLLVA